MKAGIRTSATAVVLAALSACTYPGNDLDRIIDQSERRFGPGLGREFKEVSLRELTQNATSYKYLDVRFQGIFNRRNESLFVPFLTTFRSDDFMAFSVWPADAKIWEESDRLSYVPTIYIRKDHPDLAFITGAERYTLLDIRANVMGDFDDRPFLLVTWITPIEGALYTDESLANLGGGLAAMNQKRPAVAIDKLEKALEGVWARDARLRIHLDLAKLYGERGDWEKAIVHYEGALANDAGNETAKKGLEKAREELARKRAVEAGAPPPAPKP